MKNSMIGLSGILLLLAACKSSGDPKTDPNSVSRRYNRPATEVWTAATAAIQALELRIEEDRHDALGGELRGLRATGDEVRLQVKSADEQSSVVTISIEDGDKNMAELIHKHIERHLGTGTAKTGFYGGNRWEQSVDASLAQCIVAAERAFEAIGFSVTNRDIHENWADLLARRSGSSTVLVHLETPQAPQNAPQGQQPPAAKTPPANGSSGERKGQVKVSVVAGTARSDDNEEVLQRFRQEFERMLR